MAHRRAVWGAVIVALAIIPASAAARVPNLDWTALLPPLPSPTEPQPGPVPHCESASLECIRDEADRLRQLRDRLGCDHRAVFATTYMTLTEQLLEDIRNGALELRYPKYLYHEDALFADVYFRTVRGWQQGRAIAPAWRIAFRTAASGDANAAQDMLLGINAHVQNDMPFVIAALGLRAPDGSSRKPDHDAINAVLNHAYEPVVEAVRRRYDPILSLTNARWSPVDDIAGLEVVREWREQAWRNAERLVNAKSAAERRLVTAQIHQNAAAWARGIAAVRIPPGYRQTRDEYCEERISRRAR